MIFTPERKKNQAASGEQDVDASVKVVKVSGFLGSWQDAGAPGLQLSQMRPPEPALENLLLLDAGKTRMGLYAVRQSDPFHRDRSQ